MLVLECIIILLPLPKLLLRLQVSLLTEGGCIYVDYVIFTGVFFSLNGDIIPNNGYVNIGDIGSTDDTALICNTNRPAGNDGKSGGDWFGPSGIVVGGETIGTDNVPGFKRNRDPMIVRLLRNTATDPPSGIPSEGIFHCEVEDDAVTLQTVYVGVYSSGRGILSVWCVCVCV